MDRFVDLTLSGLASGAIYAALALSLVIIYQATRLVNFAQPAMALVAVYTAATVAPLTGSYWIGFIAALTVGTAVGALAERFIVRPIARTSQLNAIIVTLGLLLIAQGGVGMIWGNQQHGFGYAFDYVGRLSPADVFALVSVGTVAVLLFCVYRFTPLGLQMRAAAFRPEAARLSGVKVGLMLTAGWAFSALIAALAGMLAGPPFISPNVFDIVFVYGITAAVVGGLDSPFGAIIGGLLVGLGMSYVSGYAGPELATLTALALVVLVLSVRPDGILSRPTARKV
ncbi:MULTISPECIES: branched-chain amino acid ABC transporter permease [Nocardiopsis]|uniref:Branched-chain amino acid ABC transporter permease n=1 Tax=Nocardiopsis lambiniae TaxID=3075539 RepID=A0ABU2M2H9_9ACTN|nr:MULTISPECIES: branched-chain amino acid ABC transporter permease [unclassified Nocardiopsis]MDE3725091.1 branched-chain amino acid ABC transporter permease [Nocardiopsis sp. N85]MDT0326850.1 branched-chain amino acid ABC transporter permease [Nocardiopsis sp. DSM 44743]